MKKKRITKAQQAKFDAATKASNRPTLTKLGAEILDLGRKQNELVLKNFHLGRQLGEQAERLAELEQKIPPTLDPVVEAGKRMAEDQAIQTIKDEMELYKMRRYAAAAGFRLTHRVRLTDAYGGLATGHPGTVQGLNDGYALVWFDGGSVMNVPADKLEKVEIEERQPGYSLGDEVVFVQNVPRCEIGEKEVLKGTKARVRKMYADGPLGVHIPSLDGLDRQVRREWVSPWPFEAGDSVRICDVRCGVRVGTLCTVADDDVHWYDGIPACKVIHTNNPKDIWIIQAKHLELDAKVQKPKAPVLPDWKPGDVLALTRDWSTVQYGVIPRGTRVRVTEAGFRGTSVDVTVTTGQQTGLTAFEVNLPIDALVKVDHKYRAGDIVETTERVQCRVTGRCLEAGTEAKVMWRTNGIALKVEQERVKFQGIPPESLKLVRFGPDTVLRQRFKDGEWVTWGDDNLRYQVVNVSGFEDSTWDPAKVMIRRDGRDSVYNVSWAAAHSLTRITWNKRIGPRDEVVVIRDTDKLMAGRRGVVHSIWTPVDHPCVCPEPSVSIGIDGVLYPVRAGDLRLAR